VHAVEQVAGSLFDWFNLIRAHRKLCAENIVGLLLWRSSQGIFGLACTSSSLCMPAARLVRALFLFYLCLPNLTTVAPGLAEDPAQINQARAKVEGYVERLNI